MDSKRMQTVVQPIETIIRDPGPFGELPAQDRALLLSAAIERRAVRGDMLTPKGGEAGALLIVVDGVFRVELIALSGQTVEMLVATAGDFFGGFALLARVPPYHVQVSCQSDGLVLEVPAPHLRKCLATMPALLQAMLIRASQTIVSLVDRLVALTTLRLRDRLLLELIGLARTAPEDGPVEIRPAPTHAAFAALLGVTREAVTRELAALSRMGVVTCRRGTIIAASRQALIDTLSDDHAGRMSDHFNPMLPGEDR